MAEEPTQVPGADGNTVEECQYMIRRSLKTPMVKFLREHLEKAGCGVGENFIKAVKCDLKISGGYVRGEGIMVCSNHMNIQDEVNQVHELIHAYDDCRATNLDWANCAHHACSEIRAGHLSGDCHYKRELMRGYMKIIGHEQVFASLINVKNDPFHMLCGSYMEPLAFRFPGCRDYDCPDCDDEFVLTKGFRVDADEINKEYVRRRVMKSVMGNPYCSEATATDAMEAVWDVCYNDTKPFDRAP